MPITGAQADHLVLLITELADAREARAQAESQPQPLSIDSRDAHNIACYDADAKVTKASLAITAYLNTLAEATPGRGRHVANRDSKVQES